MSSVEITFLGGAREVGRAAYVVKDSKATLLMDYGVSFDEEDRPVLPGHVSPKDLNAILLSHAHLDHSGALPLLYSSIRIPIYMTRTTRDLTGILINDFLKLSGYYVPYGHTEVKEMMSSVRLVKYRKEFQIPEASGATVTFYDAGHIPGSAMIKVEMPDGAKVLYTGDVKVHPTKLLSGADLNGLEADVLIIEGTYGKSIHPRREDVEALLVGDVEEVAAQGGTILIPAFSVGRSQEVLCILHERGIDIPIYLDGMVRGVTELLIQSQNKNSLRNPDLLEKAFEEAYVVRGWKDRKQIWKRPSVIIASAGMLRGGPSLYYARHLQNEARAATFLVSFQAPGTPGRRLLEEGRLEPDSGEFKPRLEWFDLSSHAGLDELLKIVGSIKNLKKVIIVHSEESTAQYFAERIKESYDLDVIIPNPNETIKIDI
ncbi:beta-lactamase [Ignicoccus islandicus DSM 13165]|uniref:Beta-lactamase n=1 Tax=Ignicoccus islandicus DSM 13165 TaxID=940295 RepID=A0A0U3F7K5_9CREN|nr:MBL fold metallo-hydrolase [Ignicoccus islandicus]ALU12024.1 beta-lactamase [Ignicoccus islandicus DSM 13165]